MGIQINISKTVYMAINCDSKDLALERGGVRKIDGYKYLGVPFTNKYSISETEIRKRNAQEKAT